MIRRDFLVKSALGGLGLTALPKLVLGEEAGLYPKVKWGIAIITWNDGYLTAFEEISKLGIKGIQIRGNVFESYKAKPAELVQILDKYNLKAPILSGGNVPFNGSEDQSVIDKFMAMATFVKQIGGKYLQATTASRDAYPPGADKLKKLAKSLNVIGEAVKAKGIRLLLHNHMHQLCQSPQEIDMVLKNTDPESVGFLLDVAHYAQAGGNPAEAIVTYKKRLELLHIKDLLQPKPGHKGKEEYNYQFVELGKGNQIQLDEILKSLKSIRFKGWCMIELDSVPNPATTPLQATKTSLDFLQAKFGYSF